MKQNEVKAKAWFGMTASFRQLLGDWAILAAAGVAMMHMTNVP